MPTPSNSHYQRLKTIAEWLDTKFKGPGGIRFGLDPLIGLIPVVGDLITLLFSTYILFSAYRMGISSSVFIRMFLNIIFEFLVELIPLLGPLFDFFWKSNTKNIQLLDEYVQNPDAVRRRSRWMIATVASLLLIFIVGCTLLMWKLVAYLLSSPGIMR